MSETKEFKKLTVESDKEFQENYYAKLAKINLDKFIEQKGKFSYVSWVHAVDQLKRFDPTATWEVLRHNGLPFIESNCGFFVEVAVTVKGITHAQLHPVLNHQNKPIAQPSSYEINTSIQRCLVKAIALHGLGLYVYAGEDLPFEAEDLVTNAQYNSIRSKAQEFAQLRNVQESDVFAALRESLEDLDRISETRAQQHITVLNSWIAKAKDALVQKNEPEEEEEEEAAAEA